MLEILAKQKNHEDRLSRLESMESPVDYSGDLNPVVNGNMSVHQRVNTVPVPNATVTYTLDQWVAFQDGNATINVSQQPIPFGETAFLPEVTPPNFLRWAQTTTGAGATNTQLVQRIENARLYAGLPIAVSFRARNSIPGATLTVNTSQTATGAVTTPDQVYNLTTSWQKYIYNTTVGNLITALSAASCFNVRFRPQFNLIQNLDITNVQLDRGNIAAPFKFEDLGTTLRRCQRYFEKSYDLNTALGTATYNGVTQATLGGAGAITKNLVNIPFKISKRIAPTAINTVFYNPAGAGNVARNDTKATLATATIANPSGENGLAVSVTGLAAWAIGDTISMQWSVSAEI